MKFNFWILTLLSLDKSSFNHLKLELQSCKYQSFLEKFSLQAVYLSLKAALIQKQHHRHLSEDLNAHFRYRAH